MTEQCIRVWVAGRVQGVGFRYFVREEAQREHLSGWARNLPDGRVEILLCGVAEAVQRVYDRVRQGPAGARVEESHHEESAERPPSGFAIY